MSLHCFTKYFCTFNIRLRALAIPISQKIWVHENIIAIFESLLAPFLVIKDPSTIYTRKKDGKTGP